MSSKESRQNWAIFQVLDNLFIICCTLAGRKEVPIQNTIGVSPVGCAGFSQDFFNCDFVGAAHGRAQAVGIGAKRALPDRMVFTYQGDGDIAAIGTQHAIHSAVRGENITSIMVNNAIFGMTGGQMVPTTLKSMKTATSPYGKNTSSYGFPIESYRPSKNL